MFVICTCPLGSPTTLRLDFCFDSPANTSIQEKAPNTAFKENNGVEPQAEEARKNKIGACCSRNTEPGDLLLSYLDNSSLRNCKGKNKKSASLSWWEYTLHFLVSSFLLFLVWVDRIGCLLRPKKSYWKLYIYLSTGLKISMNTAVISSTGSGNICTNNKSRPVNRFSHPSSRYIQLLQSCHLASWLLLRLFYIMHPFTSASELFNDLLHSDTKIQIKHTKVCVFVMWASRDGCEVISKSNLNLTLSPFMPMSPLKPGNPSSP